MKATVWRPRARVAAKVVACALLPLLLAGCSAPPAADGQHTQHHAHPPVADGRFEREMDAAMTRMMQEMHVPGYSGNPDIDFLAMMIPHHAGAVDMARLVLQHGRDPATRQLAEEIISGQTTEIEGMTRRLAALRGGTASGGAQFPMLGGTRGP